MKSQRERVLEMLRAGSCHSNDFLRVNIPRFSPRLFELKALGHNITDVREGQPFTETLLKFIGGNHR